MNSNKRDIYFDGRIYKDVPNHFHMEVEHLKADLTSYPVQGSHSFTDGMNVTGRYELERRGTTSKFFDKTFAIPTPAPVAELPKEAEGKAKELVEKFARYADCNHYEYLGAGRVEIQTSEEKKINNAKQCALITNQCEIDLINRLLATNLNNDFDLLRERGELIAVRTAINQI